MTNVEKIKNLIEGIEKYPITIMDTKTGQTMKFENRAQFESWLDPFYPQNIENYIVKEVTYDSRKVEN